MATEWPEIIYDAEKIKAEVCQRGQSSNWLVACEWVLEQNEAILAQNRLFAARLLQQRQTLLTLAFLCAYLGAVVLFMIYRAANR